MQQIPTILLSRRPRRVDEDWTAARSWLWWRAARLGAAPWPRGKDGRPLHFAAQIDLADIAAKIGADAAAGDRRAGFFHRRPWRCGLRSRTPRAATLSIRPADTPELSESGGSQHWPTDLAGRLLYPFWPPDFTALELPPLPSDDDDDANDNYAVAPGRWPPNSASSAANTICRLASRSPDRRFRTGGTPPSILPSNSASAAPRARSDALQREQKMLERAHAQASEARSIGDVAALKKAEASVSDV